MNQKKKRIAESQFNTHMIITNNSNNSKPLLFELWVSGLCRNSKYCNVGETTIIFCLNKTTFNREAKDP